MYQSFVDNNMQIDGLPLENPDEVVLEMRYCNIHFDSPNYDPKVTYSITADDEIKGFTRKELALKTMRLYHMMFYISKYYDPISGKVVDDPTKLNERTQLFRPVLHEWQYRNNGISSLKYVKENDHWICEMADYI